MNEETYKIQRTKNKATSVTRIRDGHTFVLGEYDEVYKKKVDKIKTSTLLQYETVGIYMSDELSGRIVAMSQLRGK